MKKQPIPYEDIEKEFYTPEKVAKFRAEAKRNSKRVFLADLRKLAGKTQAEVSQEMGIAQAALSRLEGQDSMQWSSLMRLAEAIGVRLDLMATFADGQQHLVTLGASPGRRPGRPKAVTGVHRITAAAGKARRKRSA